MISDMVNNTSRSVIFSIWDNDEQKLAGLYRAVRPEDLSKRVTGGFDGYFTLERLGDFVSGLRKSFSDERYVIRDWLADSAQDYYRTRLLWTADDVSKHLPPNRVGSADGAPPPVLQVGEANWEISGIELFTNSIGIPPGLPIDRQRTVAAMQDYLESRKDETRSHADGKRRFETYADVPMQWFRLSATNRLTALKAFDHYLDAKEGRFAEFLIPQSSADIYRALRTAYGDRARLIEDSSENRYYFHTLEDQNLINEWWIGSHRDELLRAFGDLVA